METRQESHELCNDAVKKEQPCNCNNIENDYNLYSAVKTKATVIRGCINVFVKNIAGKFCGKKWFNKQVYFYGLQYGITSTLSVATRRSLNRSLSCQRVFRTKARINNNLLSVIHWQLIYYCHETMRCVLRYCVNFLELISLHQFNPRTAKEPKPSQLATHSNCRFLLTTTNGPILSTSASFTIANIGGLCDHHTVKTITK